MGEGQGGGGQNKFGFPLPLIPSQQWLCRNMKKTDILKDERSGRVEKI